MPRGAGLKRKNRSPETGSKREENGIAASAPTVNFGTTLVGLVFFPEITLPQLNAHKDLREIWLGTDKLTGFHAAFSNGGVGSNIHAKRYRCVDSGGCQAKRSLKSPLRTAARTCNMRCAPWSDHCICCFLTIRRATRQPTADSASEEAIRRPDR
jgi:hypothetical protein